MEAYALERVETVRDGVVLLSSTAFYLVGEEVRAKDSSSTYRGQRGKARKEILGPRLASNNERGME